MVQESAEEEGRQGLESSSKYHAPQQNHIINSVSMCGYCTVKHFLHTVKCLVPLLASSRRLSGVLASCRIRPVPLTLAGSSS